MTDVQLIGECSKVAIDQLEQVKIALQNIVKEQVDIRQNGSVKAALKFGFEQSIERIQIQIDGLKEVLGATKL